MTKVDDMFLILPIVVPASLNFQSPSSESRIMSPATSTVMSPVESAIVVPSMLKLSISIPASAVIFDENVFEPEKVCVPERCAVSESK